MRQRHSLDRRGDQRTDERGKEQAIVTAAFEAISRFLVAGRTAELPGLLPLVCHLVLTPFIGAEEADALIARKVSEVVAGDGGS